MGKIFMMLLAVMSATMAWGAYTVETFSPYFYFEDEGSGAYYPEPTGARSYSSFGWYRFCNDFVSDYVFSGPGDTFDVSVEMLDDHKTLKAWGVLPVSGMGYRSEIAWTDAASTKITCAYDSRFEGQNVLLFLHFRWYRFNLFFDSNGGSAVDAIRDIPYKVPTGAMDSLGHFAYEEKSVDLPVASKTGHAFAGWKRSDGNIIKGTVKSSGIGIGRDGEDIKLTAQWTPNRYAVTLNAQGGTVSSGMISTYTYGVGATLPEDVVRNGYTFEGWYTAVSGGTRVTAINSTEYGDKTYYAQWTVNTYNVTLNAQGGTINSGMISTYTHGVGATLPEDVVRNGYTFEGWYTAASGGTRVTAINSTEYGDKTYYAQWSGIFYAVEFFGMDGISLGVQSVPCGESAVAPDVPPCVGMTFVGWDPFDFGNVISNMSIYARFDTNRYVVAYDANGGVGSMTNDMVFYGMEYKIRSNEFTRAMCDFAGWATSRDAKTNEVDFTYGEVVSNLTAVANGTSTVYAVWANLLTEYSDAVGCTNLLLDCAVQNRKWTIDHGSGFDGGPSVCAQGECVAIMAATIEGPGTLTFMLKANSQDGGNIDDLQFSFARPDGTGRLSEYLKTKVANGEWIACVFNKTAVEAEEYRWIFVGASDAAAVHVDQVRWYPGRFVDVDWNDGGDAVYAIKKAILEHWGDIFNEDSAVVSSVKIDKHLAGDISRVHVTNALPMLNLGYSPSYVIENGEATLTFTNSPSVSIASFQIEELPDVKLVACVTNTVSGTPKWFDGVEQMLGVWGAATLTSAWGRVDSEIDLTRYVESGEVGFGFDAGTNKFFKVRAAQGGRH